MNKFVDTTGTNDSPQKPFKKKNNFNLAYIVWCYLNHYCIITNNYINVHEKDIINEKVSFYSVGCTFLTSGQQIAH